MAWIVDNFDYWPNLIFRLPSFPRRRESRFIRAETVKEKSFLNFMFWIPACAGMTAALKIFRFKKKTYEEGRLKTI